MYKLQKGAHMLYTTVKQKDILYTYTENTVQVVVCKPRMPRKSITVKPRGSLKHCGKTNVYGQRI
jgi:hypothetical protein